MIIIQIIFIFNNKKFTLYKKSNISLILYLLSNFYKKIKIKIKYYNHLDFNDKNQDLFLLNLN